MPEFPTVFSIPQASEATLRGQKPYICMPEFPTVFSIPEACWGTLTWTEALHLYAWISNCLLNTGSMLRHPCMTRSPTFVCLNFQLPSQYRKHVEAPLHGQKPYICMPEFPTAFSIPEACWGTLTWTEALHLYAWISNYFLNTGSVLRHPYMDRSPIFVCLKFPLAYQYRKRVESRIE
jgi:hypothetical protein